MKSADDAARDKLQELYHDALVHDGNADIRIEIRSLGPGQKEVLLHSGKRFRFVVTCQAPSEQLDAASEGPPPH